MSESSRATTDLLDRIKPSGLTPLGAFAVLAEYLADIPLGETGTTTIPFGPELMEIRTVQAHSRTVWRHPR
jgi:hypothetical protein